MAGADGRVNSSSVVRKQETYRKRLESHNYLLGYIFKDLRSCYVVSPGYL